MKLVLPICIVLAILTVGCASPTPTPTSVPPTATPVPPTPVPTATRVPPTATPVSPTATPTLVQPTATPTKPLSPTALPALSAAPRALTFKALDGQELKGTYYPAASNPAPVIVLMHWAGGDQSDWIEIAAWLQNRGQGGKTPKDAKRPWLDPSWFPTMLNGKSFAVFTFTFRGCEGSCKTLNGAKWLVDAQAAMKFASELEGVDSKKIIAAGASIGADGAAHGCAWLNAQKGAGVCLGAFPLSPGGYLTLPFAAAALPLQNETPPKPVWCLYGEADNESAPACKSATGKTYRAIAFAGKSHGMSLIDPTIKPKDANVNTLQLMLDWIKTGLGM